MTRGDLHLASFFGLAMMLLEAIDLIADRYLSRRRPSPKKLLRVDRR